MTVSIDKLLEQQEQIRRAGQGERIKVKQPRLAKPGLLSTDILLHGILVHKVRGHGLKMRVWGKVSNDGRTIATTHGEVRCADCSINWQINQEQAIELRPQLHTVIA